VTTQVRLLVLACCIALGGCETMSSWIPTIPVPSLSWLGIGRGAKKPRALPAFEAKANARVEWQVAMGGKGGFGFSPAVRKEVIYAASPDGTIVSVEPSDRASRTGASAPSANSLQVSAPGPVASSSGPTRPTFRLRHQR